MQIRRVAILLFITHLLTRLVFVVANGFYNNMALQADSIWLVKFGDLAASGNFNFELERFIASPLYPVLCGIFKLIFYSHWNTSLIIFQLLLASLSGVYIYKIAELLFKNGKTALVASLLYAIFPLTLWFVNTFSQESIFQSLFIFTIYFLLKSLESPGTVNVIKAAVLFSLAYLTKSHILLFSLFIPLIYFHRFGLTRLFFKNTIIFAAISLAFSIPYGLYHQKANGTYVLSSNGSGYQFYLGNTEAGYKSIVDVPAKESEDYKRIKDINVMAGYFNGDEAKYDSLLRLPQNIKQKSFTNEAYDWIRQNPAKFIQLKIYNLAFFLMPGVSFRHYSLSNWLFSFLLSFPVYLLAYVAIFIEFRKNRVMNSVIIYVFFTMVIFSTLWYVQNRFRTVTIEPFYIIYCATIISQIADRIPLLHHITDRIVEFYGSRKEIS